MAPLQGHSQTLNIGWAREEHFLIFPHSSIVFSHFPQSFPIFFLNLVLHPYLCHHCLQQLNCTTQLIGNILLVSDDIIAQAEESYTSASRLLDVLDELLLSTRIEGDQMSIVTPSLAVGLVDVDVMKTTDQWYDSM